MTSFKAHISDGLLKENYMNNKDKEFSIAGRMRSFRYAFKGIAFMFETQHNAWIHLAATIAVCIAGWRLHISSYDWRWLVVAIVLVWFAEAINTAFEYICDVVCPEFHLSVEKAKDIAAGAVLVCTMGAAALGIFIFAPYLLD